jgi:hypothetical protein
MASTGAVGGEGRRGLPRTDSFLDRQVKGVDGWWSDVVDNAKAGCRVINGLKFAESACLIGSRIASPETCQKMLIACSSFKSGRGLLSVVSIIPSANAIYRGCFREEYKRKYADITSTKESPRAERKTLKTQSIFVADVARDALKLVSDSFKVVEWLMANKIVATNSFVVKPAVWLVGHGVLLGPLSSVLLKVSGVSKFFTLGRASISVVVHLKGFASGNSEGQEGRVHLYALAHDVLKISLIIFAVMMPWYLVVGFSIVSNIYTMREATRNSLNAREGDLLKQLEANGHKRAKAAGLRLDEKVAQERQSPSPHRSPSPLLEAWDGVKSDLLTPHAAMVHDLYATRRKRDALDNSWWGPGHNYKSLHLEPDLRLRAGVVGEPYAAESAA